MSAQTTSTSISKPPTALATMHSWAQFDPENVLLNEITKGRKRYAVRKFVHDLTQAKIWHGKKRVREYPAERKPKPNRQDSASPRKSKRASPSSSSPPLKKAKSSAASPIRKRPSPATSPLQPKVTRSQVQREEAEAKKAQEAEAAASVGSRRSTRVRVPTRKALDA